MAEKNLTGKIIAHLRKWLARLSELKGVKTECLEVYMACASLFLYGLFAFHVPWKLLDAMGQKMPVVLWETFTLSLFLISLVGYLEDLIFLRRWGGFLAFTFYIVSGVALYPSFPYAGSMHIGHSFLFSWVWTRVGQEDIKRRVRDEPVILEVAEVQIVKMPKRV